MKIRRLIEDFPQIREEYIRPSLLKVALNKDNLSVVEGNKNVIGNLMHEAIDKDVLLADGDGFKLNPLLEGLYDSFFWLNIDQLLEIEEFILSKYKELKDALNKVYYTYSDVLNDNGTYKFSVLTFMVNNGTKGWSLDFKSLPLKDTHIMDFMGTKPSIYLGDSTKKHKSIYLFSFTNTTEYSKYKEEVDDFVHKQRNALVKSIYPFMYIKSNEESKKDIGGEF